MLSITQEIQGIPEPFSGHMGQSGNLAKKHSYNQAWHISPVTSLSSPHCYDSEKP